MHIFSVLYLDPEVTYCKETNGHGKSGDSGALFLEEPSQFVHTAVIEGVSGDGVPAFAR